MGQLALRNMPFYVASNARAARAGGQMWQINL